MLVSNHRSFFDQYAMLLACYMGPVPWAKRLYFPVRSNFFYDHPLGIAVNVVVAGGAMYPPIYRQAERRALNDEALDKMVEILARPGQRRSACTPRARAARAPTRTSSCRAQPGVGKIALLGKPIVIPTFILGLGNNIAAGRRVELPARRAPRARGDRGVRPADRLLATCSPRSRGPTLYKKTADRFMAEIKKLSRAREGAARRARAPARSPTTTRAGSLNRRVGKLYAFEGKEP